MRTDIYTGGFHDICKCGFINNTDFKYLVVKYLVVVILHYFIQFVHTINQRDQIINQP